MTETIERYLEILEEFLQGKRGFGSIPPKLDKAFGMNYRGSYHLLCGIKSRMSATTWNQVVALYEPARESVRDDFVHLEGTVDGQEVALRYYTRNRGTSFWSSGVVNGKEIPAPDVEVLVLAPVGKEDYF